MLRFEGFKEKGLRRILQKLGLDSNNFEKLVLEGKISALENDDRVEKIHDAHYNVKRNYIVKLRSGFNQSGILGLLTKYGFGMPTDMIIPQQPSVKIESTPSLLCLTFLDFSGEEYSISVGPYVGPYKK